MAFKSLRFVLTFFCFLGHVIGQGMTKETHAHDSYYNSKFDLFTRCQPIHIHVDAFDVVSKSAYPNPETTKVTPNEKLQKEVHEFIERRLRTARLYQETAQNYLYVHVLEFWPQDGHKLGFDFMKMLYDQATDSWGYAATHSGNNINVPTGELMSYLSTFLDHFLEQYVEENKAFCR